MHKQSFAEMLYNKNPRSFSWKPRGFTFVIVQ